MRLQAVIFTILLLINISQAQESENIDMSYRLYFRGNSVSYVQMTTTPVEVYSSDTPIYQFDWSPDGSYVFLLVNVDKEMIVMVYDSEFTLVSQNEVNLYGHWSSFPVVWSNDGQNIIAVQQNDSGEPIISIMPIDTEQNIQTFELPLEPSSRVHRIYWSSDSSAMAYQVTDIDDSRSVFTPDGQPREFRLSLFDLSSQLITEITETSFDGCVAWSYDSSQVAYVESRDLDREYPYFLRSHNLVIAQIYEDTQQIIELPQNSVQALDCPIAWSRQGDFVSLSDKLATENDESDYEPSQRGISIVNLITKEIEHIFYTNGEPYTIFDMMWSPDDAWIAIQANYSAFSDIRLINYKQKQEYLITLDGIPLSNIVWREQ